MTNLVLHADADAFFASVAMRSQPGLRGVPMAVFAHVFIASANYPARARGIRGGMSTQDALRRCPELVLVDVPHAEIEEVGDALFDLFHDCALAVEPGSIEEAFLDVGATDLATARAAAETIRGRAARELGIPVSVGIGRTKLMAKLASRAAKPDGVRAIDEVQDAELRATLPLTEVWGVGAKTVQRLEALGVHRLADLDEVSPDRVLAACGTTMARRLQRIREGTDDAEVRPVEARTALHAEGSIAGYARPDHTPAELVDLCVRRVCKRAERAGLIGTGITLTLRPESGAAAVVRKQAAPVAVADTATWLPIATGLLEGWVPSGLAGVRVSLTGLRPQATSSPTLF